MLLKIYSQSDKDKIKSYIERLPLREKGYKILIESITQARSGNQNRYMWYVFKLISDETGQNKDDVHNFYVQKFIGKYKEVFGEVISTGNTSKLDTKQFEEFMKNVREHAQEFLNILVPLPNEVIYEE